LPEGKPEGTDKEFTKRQAAMVMRPCQVNTWQGLVGEAIC